MKRLMLPAGAALAALAPGVAAAKPATPAHARAYERAYREVAHKFGRRVPGRNIIKDGVRRGRAATDAETLASLVVLHRMLAPPPAPAPAAAAAPVAAPTQTSAVTPTVPATGGAGGVPACASESGTNYSTGAANTNASSGATGRYQITPSTAANYGCSLATPAGQDACAQTIYEHQGAGAWVGCGG
jgi:hypothetical protein